MYKDYRYINAGTNEYYRWGRKAVAKLEACLIPNDKGYFTIAADGGKYWTIGTSEGKYGKYAKYKDTYFSVNSNGDVWAKVGTPKGDSFVKMINELLDQMNNTTGNSSIEED